MPSLDIRSAAGLSTAHRGRSAVVAPLTGQTTDERLEDASTLQGPTTPGVPAAGSCARTIAPDTQSKEGAAYDQVTDRHLCQGGACEAPPSIAFHGGPRAAVGCSPSVASRGGPRTSMETSR